MALPGEDPVSALRDQRFAFFPAIRGLNHNEWSLRDSTWSEIQVENIESGQSIWIPRSALGDVSSADEPQLIVGLKRELEYKAGSIVPYRAKVVALPERREPPSPSPNIGSFPTQRPKDASESQDRAVGRIITWALAFGGAFALLIAAVIGSGGRLPFASLFRADTSTTDQLYIGMTGETNFEGVVRRLGPPEDDRWVTPDDAPIQIRVAAYPSRRYGVVLMGGARETANYAGTIHLPSRQLLDSVPLSGGRSTGSLLRNLPEF